jgi:hypothetical protein
MTSSKNTVSKNSEINKLLKEINFTKISKPSPSSSSAPRKKRPKFTDFSPTRSNARSKKMKSPGPPSINTTPARETKNIKKPFVQKYSRHRTGTKTNEIPSWLENIFNKK